MSYLTDIERLNYYEGEFLGAVDFQAEQEYHRDMRRRHNLGQQQMIEAVTHDQTPATAKTDLNAAEAAAANASKLRLDESRGSVSITQAAIPDIEQRSPNAFPAAERRHR